jgi:4-hydroxy-tetrahydrodipicolinate reductase
VSGTANSIPRIVIYGTGQYGSIAARIALEKGWPVAAAVNRAGDKVGQDLGRLAGLGHDCGIVVQDCELADYEAIDADLAIVATTDRLAVNYPVYERLMNAGMNVICHGAESSFPMGADAALAGRIDALAKRNGVSFCGTGLWDMSRIWSGILVAGPCTRIESMFLESLTNIGAAGKHVLDVVGVGLTPDEYRRKFVDEAGPVGNIYKLIPEHVLTALGFTVTSSTEVREPVIFDEPVHCRYLQQDIEPGLAVGTRVVATVETREGVSAKTSIELRLIRDGEQEHVAWRVEGQPRSLIRVDRRGSVYSSASTMINRVRDVIAASPGIRLVSELGPLKPSWRDQAGR